MKKVNLKSPKTRKPAPTLIELMAREHRRVEKLTRERDAKQRQLIRARVRYSVVKRLAEDQAARAVKA